ncbi:hypothetical protein TNCV_2182471 [Trichonephila clavipes]|uniref:Uncharacterized protein n=1 Tax=Trichonephila clavipes TaxID=2585209 RepID=A0A8X6VV59_TRICX|nr:hypothetical protein TNCV_2182471 [Trichonephila clavipes]
MIVFNVVFDYNEGASRHAVFRNSVITVTTIVCNVKRVGRSQASHDPIPVLLGYKKGWGALVKTTEKITHRNRARVSERSIDVALQRYMRAIGDRPRHFGPHSSDEDDIRAGTLQRDDDRINVHKLPLHGGSSAA